MKNRLRIILIGSGNVGFHLGKKLTSVGIKIEQVFSRKKSKAKRLAKVCNSTFTNSFSEVSKNGDLYILAVPDSAIEKVADNLSKNISPQKLVVHTSGATPSTILKPYFKQYGIFYPLQTFSINREVDFEKIPICVDANLKKNRLLLENLAKRIANNIYQINDKQRAILHVAAVFVNNFSNNLFTIGEQITKEENLPFEILKPLIQESVEKIKNHSPLDMQTGPAIRGDETTIEKHLEYLKKKFPQFVEVYQTMTQSINPIFSKQKNTK